MQSDPQKKKLPSQTEKKPYIRTIDVNGKEVQFVVNDAMYANILNEEILIDKLSIDFMLDEIATAIQSNPSKNTPLPKTVLISQENLNELLNASSISQNIDSKTINDNVKLEIIETPNTINNISNIENTDTVNNKEKLQIIKTPNDINPNITLNSSTQKTNVTSEDEKINDTLNKATTSDDFLKVYKPRYTFDEVYVDPVFKRRIVSALIMAKERKRIYDDWGLLKTLKSMRPLVLNFYGPPGTGKSMMAEAIASYLKKDVFLVNYSELESGTPGETPKNIVKCFLRAKAENSVLIFDEADSFLGKRLTNVSSAADYGINITRSVMLIELEKFDGVIVFTTNFISNYDIAFKRRILASIEFKLPDEKGRAHIWNSHIPSLLPLSPGITPMSLAFKYAGTTGADIKDIILFAAVNCLERGRERLSWEDFDEAYQTVKNRYSVV